MSDTTTEPVTEPATKRRFSKEEVLEGRERAGRGETTSQVSAWLEAPEEQVGPMLRGETYSEYGGPRSEHSVEVALSERAHRGLGALALLQGQSLGAVAGALLSDAVDLALHNEVAQRVQSPVEDEPEEKISLGCPSCATVNAFPAMIPEGEKLQCQECEVEAEPQHWIPVT